MSLRCPRCGADHIETDRKLTQGRCPVVNCNHEDKISKFEGLSIEYGGHFSNETWRDPVAMSMDGYDYE